MPGAGNSVPGSVSRARELAAALARNMNQGFSPGSRIRRAANLRATSLVDRAQRLIYEASGQISLRVFAGISEIL